MAREISSDIKRLGEKPVASKSYLPPWLRDHFAYIAAALLIAVTLVGLFLYWNAGSTSNHLVESLAIMPLENGSADPEMDYLSDGITENLINSLSQLPELRVLARSSVFRYKGKTIDPIKIGQDLKVDAVLTGRLAQRGDALSIQAELVNTQDGGQLWGDQFQRKMADIFAVQEEISLRISQALKLKLTGEQRRLITLPRSENLEANVAYAKGVQRLNARTGPDIEKAVGFFRESIAKDPKYAPAYAGLAYSFALLGSMEYGAMAPNDSIPNARAAAQRAIQLDVENRLADPHVVMGFVHLYYDWNFEEAEAEFRRAIEIDPPNTTAHHWYAEFLAATKRFDEALNEIRVAQARDPLASIINTAEGRIHFLKRNYSAAADRLVQTLAIDNNFVMAQVALGMVYGQQGNYAQAETLLQQASALTGGPPVVQMSLAYNYAKAGNTTESLKIVQSLTEEKRYVSPAYLAAIYAGLGNKDQAFRYLDQAVEERSGSLVFLGVEPMADSLRSDPRFSALLNRIRPGL
jgi:TolB-like protein/Tfp pilus assembly protein PilF